MDTLQLSLLNRPKDYVEALAYHYTHRKDSMVSILLKFGII